MGLLAAGQVVVLPFPFSDLSRHKYRPVLVLADACRGDWIACQITSNPYYVRPGKLFTAHADLMEQIVGTVKSDFLNRAREAVIQVIRGKP